MNKTIILIMLTLQIALTAHAETFNVELDGDNFVLSGQSEVRGGNAIIRNVKIFAQVTKETYLLASGMGYGERPLDTLCRQVTNSEYPFASSYGQVAPMATFFPKKVLILQPDQKNHGEFSHFEVVDGKRVSLYYLNLLCTQKKSDY